MGLVNGETVLVERVAPLGDPVEFLVKGYHLSLRRADAAHIEVRVLPNAARGKA
jgi:Fe2+ transport system protein FeoA